MEENRSPRYIFIGNPIDRRWPAVVEETLPEASRLEIADDEAGMQLIIDHDYDAIFIDNSAIKNFTLLISRIRAQRPEARVVVIAQQDWKLARDAFLSGATDYICKSQSKEDLASSLLEARVRPVRIAMAAGGGY
jgi:DNA-binding NarL/FixJ family response regulator